MSDKMPRDLRVETPLGAILVRVSDDPDHPGVWIDLRRPDVGEDMPTRVWGDGMRLEYTDRIVHQGIDYFFKIEEAR